MTHRVERDLVFASREGFRPLTLDLHLPEVEHPPVIVFVHGGGWRVGSRRMFTPGVSEDASFGRLVRAGFTVASIDYRLSGEAIFPAPLHDVISALEWVRGDGAREHGLDSDRIVLWGESAGAHLASLAAFQDGAVRGVVDWYGPADLLTFPQGDDPATTREAGLLGGAIVERSELARDASPLHHITPTAPPFHIAHGDSDGAVPFAQSTAFADALRAAGVEVSFQAVPGADHMWRGLSDVGAVFEPALEFTRRVTVASA